MANRKYRDLSQRDMKSLFAPLFLSCLVKPRLDTQLGKMCLSVETTRDSGLLNLHI